MEQYVVTFLATVPTIVIVFQFVKNTFGLADGAAQVASWVTGFVIASLAHLAGWGVWAEFSFPWQLLVWSFGASLAANGVFDTGLMKAILKAIDKYFFGKR